MTWCKGIFLAIPIALLFPVPPPSLFGLFDWCRHGTALESAGFKSVYL